MSLSHAILAILNVMPLTGYDLKHLAFDATIIHFWPADQAQIYRTLDRLAEKGLVQSEIEAQVGRPDRKVYSLTEAGQAELNAWLVKDEPFPPYRDAFLIRLFFAVELSDEEILKLLDGQERFHRERLARLGQLPIPPVPAGEKLSRWQTLQRLTLELGTMLDQTYIEWLEKCREVAETLPPADPDWREVVTRSLPGEDD